MQNQELYEKAKARAEEKLGFYMHFAAYVVVNLLLIAVNLWTSPEYYWFKWSLIGWGIGLLFHGLGTFVFCEGSGIQDRMIEKEMEKLERRKRPPL